ncbi:hypothetical protein [uncultured Limimaricola sp.]|uniref:hypothetical protein n=1 Tax=uncultured Limimaricola sp. TaxID=2211667 RepID=UPI0030FA02D3
MNREKINRTGNNAYRRCCRKCFAVLVFLALSACTPPRGAAQFIQYTEAFSASRQASEALFDLVEVAERDQARLAYNAELAEFDPSRPYLYSDLAAPPLASEYRTSFNVISRYNQLMVALITGESAGVLLTQVTELETSALAIAATATSTARLQGLASVMEVISVVARDAVAVRDRRVVAAELAQSADAVMRLMRTMRLGAPDIYNLLRATAGSDNDSTRRRLVADWIVLMDRNIEALQAAVIASENTSRASTEFQSLQARMTELQNAADSIKASLAELAK